MSQLHKLNRGAYDFRVQGFSVADIQMIMFIAVMTALVGIFL